MCISVVTVTTHCCVCKLRMSPSVYLHSVWLLFQGAAMLRAQVVKNHIYLTPLKVRCVNEYAIGT